MAWINTPRKEGGLGSVKIPLLSDLTHKISKDYGVYLEASGHALRGLFIIDQRGVLRQITMNDLPVGRSVDETIRLVQAFQYTDTHGEVCPAGWRPGADTVSTQYLFTNDQVIETLSYRLCLTRRRKRSTLLETINFCPTPYMGFLASFPFQVYFMTDRKQSYK